MAFGTVFYILNLLATFGCMKVRGINMSGYDFNHDGKIDHQDYYLHEEIFENEEQKSTSTPTYHYSSGSRFDTLGGWIRFMLPGIYLSCWMKGAFGFNFLSGILGLICAGYYAVLILCWAYS